MLKGTGRSSCPTVLARAGLARYKRIVGFILEASWTGDAILTKRKRREEVEEGDQMEDVEEGRMEVFLYASNKATRDVLVARCD